MKTLLLGGNVLTEKGFEKLDLAIDRGRVFIPSYPSQEMSLEFDNSIDKKVIRCDNFFIIPGFIDVHVHFREPGFGYKETIKTGSLAAAAGGYTTVCTMPNVSPAPVNRDSLKIQLDLIKEKSVVKIIPYGCITTADERDKSGARVLAPMEEMSRNVIGFSDDGRGVQDRDTMASSMKKSKKLGKFIAAHCEDESYDTYDPRSEFMQVERDIDLVRTTGCHYHICHVSTKETVEMVRNAKKEGLPITCETAPHYVLFNDEEIEDKGRFKMNPPIRSRQDQEAIITGVIDGTIDVIATDHAPHSAEEKSRGFHDSMFGIIGLETAFPVMYTHMVARGKISMEKLIDLMAIAPRRIFGKYHTALAEDLIRGLPFAAGETMTADIAIIDVSSPYEIEPDKFYSKGRSTPFDGMKVRGKILYTFVNGKLVWGEVE